MGVARIKVDYAGLAEALKTKQSDEGLSGSNIADATGYSKSSISRWMRAEPCDVDAYAALCLWLGVPLEHYLVGYHRPEVKHVPSAVQSILRSDSTLTERKRAALFGIFRAAYINIMAL